MTSRAGLIIKNDSPYMELFKSKTLISYTQKILDNPIDTLLDDSWITRIFDWADENKIDDLYFIKKFLFITQN